MHAPSEGTHPIVGASPTNADVGQAATVAIAALDESFFRVRFDRLTPIEKRYMRAIAKRMVWSPSHGDTAFTVPLCDEFMKRIMPGTGWRTT